MGDRDDNNRIRRCIVDDYERESTDGDLAKRFDSDFPTDIGKLTNQIHSGDDLLEKLGSKSLPLPFVEGSGFVELDLSLRKIAPRSHQAWP